MCSLQHPIQIVCVSYLHTNSAVPATVTQEGLPLIETDCISCGQCSSFCPVGAITEKDDVAEVLRALDDPTVIPVLQTAPSVSLQV